MNPSTDFTTFVQLVGRLRKECPWDRKQTHDSIKDNLIEEAYEVVEAIDSRRPDELKMELGDLLLQVVFHSRMAEETGSFTIGDVIYSISQKLIRRHPHIFTDLKIDSDREVAENWESIKLKEGKSSLLEGLPAHLPALIRAKRMQEKASNVGFDWPEWQMAWEKLNEELEEWKAAVESGDEEHFKEEFGDLLFSMVNVGRLLNIDAEDSLRGANRKFENRFRFIEESLRKSGTGVSEASLEEMDRLWNEAKEGGR